jgi:erythrocyte band 7 integral membrane protein
VQQQLAQAEQHGEGPSSYQHYDPSTSEFGGNAQGFQNAVNARVVENM